MSRQRAPEFSKVSVLPATRYFLVMAFAGVDETRALYRAAIDDHYRFYSFGDATLIL